MDILKDVEKTFSFAFGTTRTGKTVVITVLDDAGNVVGSGYSAGTVVDLGGGVYGVAITFSDNILGYIKANNTTDGLVLFQPINVINDYRDDISTILTNTNKIPPRIKKNTSLSNFMFLMTDSTNHAPSTGLTVTAQRAIDGGSFASCANSVSEVANGIYKIDLAAADLNGDVVTLRFTATGSDDRLISIVLQV